MPIDPKHFKPNVTPEQWMTPVNGCRLSTLLTLHRYQTLDEAFKRADGSGHGRTLRTKTMKRLRALASDHRGESPQEALGYSWADAIYAYRAMWPAYKVHKWGLRSSDIKARLRQGYAISVSGNVGRTPAGSILRAAVNPVPHEIGLIRLSKDENSVLVYEPMRRDKPVWVPWSHVKAFSSAFTYDNGRRYCIAIKIAWGTREAFARRANERAQDDANAAAQATEDMLESAHTEIATLERQGAEGWDTALVAIIDNAEALREDGYQPD